MSVLIQNLPLEPGPNGRFTINDGNRPKLHAIHPWTLHHLYHDECRRAFREADGQLPRVAEGEEMIARGYRSFHGLLEQSEVDFLTGMIDQRIADSGGAPARDEWGWSLPWNMLRIQAVRPIIARVFNGVLGDVLTQYFGCHFRLFSLSLTRGFPGSAQGSFTWHRDVEPPQQTHLMLYLTPSSDEGGGTSFIDLEETRRAATAGYHFPADAERVTHLRDLGPDGGAFHPDKPTVAPGDGILFGAPRVLHKGMLPTAGHRDVMTALILPSPVPWEEYLARGTARVFVTQHPGVSSIDPFEDRVIERKPLTHVPDWALAGDLFPPNYQG